MMVGMLIGCVTSVASLLTAIGVNHKLPGSWLKFPTNIQNTTAGNSLETN